MKRKCFDCSIWTGAGTQVWRNSDESQIDWSQPDPTKHSIVVYVCRAGTGCNRERWDSDVRTGAAPKSEPAPSPWVVKALDGTLPAKVF